MKASFFGTVLLSATSALAAISCDAGYYPGYDEVVVTLPYTYQQVMSVIGSFRNITWSGSPYDSVTLNGTDNTVGTARTYVISNATLIETLSVYDSPPNGPYHEDHVLSPLYLAAYNLSTYSPHDTTTVTPICDNTAVVFNMSVVFCANDATVGAAVYNSLHASDIATVDLWLGNATFTGCAANTTGSIRNTTITPNATGTSAINYATFTGVASVNAITAGSILASALSVIATILLL